MKLTHKRQILEGEAARLLAVDGNISRAALRLGVNRCTLHRWLKAKKFQAQIQAARQQPTPPRTAAESGESPVELGVEASAWRNAILEEYALSETELALLERAATALDRAIAAGRLLQDGLIQGGKPHPALRIELDQANLFRQLVRQLNFPSPVGAGENVIPISTRRA
jgi:hypothetical protein